MKSILFTLTILLFSGANLSAQDNQKSKFYSAMGKALSGYNNCETADDFYTLSLNFARIAASEQDEWLPKYYQAHAIAVGNFRSSAEANSRDQKLDEAQTLIDQMRKMDSADQSEVETLQAMVYTGKLVVDPASRGHKYSGLSAKATKKALSINSNNPRAQYSQLSNARGSAQWFGKDLAPFCDQGKDLLKRWDELNANTSPLFPSWGKDQVREIANACG